MFVTNASLGDDLRLTHGRNYPSAMSPTMNPLIGCGHGASTILMAKAFPNSTFVGFAYQEASIERARPAAAEAGVSDRGVFQIASAKDFPGEDYDLIRAKREASKQ